jgi:hypothetical protein
MTEFEAHWADKLVLTIDRHEYKKLLDRPTKQVKQMKKKQTRKYRQFEAQKKMYNKLNRQRKLDIETKIAKGRRPFDLQRFEHDIRSQINVFVDLTLFKKQLKQQIEDIFYRFNYQQVFKQTDRSDIVTSLWKKTKKWSCHM